MKNKILLPKSKIFLLLLLMATLLAGCEKDTEPPMHPNDYFTSEPFLVSATKQVRFSQGNLQYQASTNTWRFAETQYSIVGNANENISSSYSGWIDLFGRGTSGSGFTTLTYTVSQCTAMEAAGAVFCRLRDSTMARASSTVARTATIGRVRATSATALTTFYSVMAALFRATTVTLSGTTGDLFV